MSTICDTTKLNRRGFVVEKSFYKFVNNEIPRARPKPSPRFSEREYFEPSESARLRIRGRMGNSKVRTNTLRYNIDNVIRVVNSRHPRLKSTSRSPGIARASDFNSSLASSSAKTARVKGVCAMTLDLLSPLATCRTFGVPTP